MADDITLTVRVRDMTRGEFNQIRQRMRGMGGDVRRIARAADGATQSSDRFANSLTGLQRRLSQFQRTGTLARHEMDFMRRSMGLLGRDLRRAAADGELTEDQFRDLRNELERTRLDFDHLGNQIRRQDAIAQRAARNRAARQREAQRQQREAEREARRQERETERRAREERRRQEALGRSIVAEQRRIAQAHAAALREEAARNLAAQRDAQRLARDEIRRQTALGNQIIAQRRRVARAHAAALREEAQRNRRAEAERQRALRAAAAAQRREVGRLAGLSDDDRGLTLRFRALGEDDMRRMTRGFGNLQNAINGVSGSTDRARRTVRSLGGDLRTMSQALQDAQNSGNITRREFNALSNGLRLTTRDARQLVRSGDLTRSAFRDMRREVTRLQAQLRLLGREGTVFDRLDARLLLLQRRMRDTREGAGRVRRTLSRMDEGVIGGLRLLTRGLGLVSRGFGRLRTAIAGASRGMRMFLLVLALLGPLAGPVGALLVTALGGAFVALGAFALRSEKTIRSAFNRMKTTVGSSVREAAQPLRGALVKGMDQVGAAVVRMQPLLEAAFTATAPLVRDLFGSITDIAARAMPGITTALREAGPVIEGFREGIGLVGEGFGDMFAAMTAGGGAQGLRDSFVNFGDELREVLIDLGEFINKLSQSESATLLLAAALETVSAILTGIERVFQLLDGVFGPLIRTFDDLGSSTSKAGLSLRDLDESFSGGGKSAKELKRELADVDKQIAKLTSQGDLEDLKRLFTEGEIFDVKRNLGLEEGSGRQDEINSLLATRQGLLGAIADAEQNAADKTRDHTRSIQEQVEAIRQQNADNISFFDAQTRAQEALDKLNESFKENGNTLKKGTEEGRLNRDAVSALAQAHNALFESAEKTGVSMETVEKEARTLREALVEQATQALGSKAAAEEYANALLGTPKSVETLFKLQKEQATAGLKEVRDAIEDTPNAKSVTVSTLNEQAIRALEEVGFKTERLPDGDTKVFTATGSAVTNIEAVDALLNALNGKVATTTVNNIINTHERIFRSVIPGPLQSEQAMGGPIHRALGGGVISGPGTSMSDSIPAMLSDGEFVIRAAAVRKVGEGFLNRVNRGEIRPQELADGGSVKQRREEAKRRREEARRRQREARGELRGQVGIGRFGRAAGFQLTPFQKKLARPDSVGDLVRTLREFRSLIKQATSGRQERQLTRQIDIAGRAFIRHEKRLEKVNKQLDKARDRLQGLQQAAASLRQSVKSGIIGETNITRAATAEDSRVTINTILSQMTGSKENAQEFSRALQQLRKRGLDKGLIAEIAEAGVAGGGLETAQALLGGSQGQIQQLNQMRVQIIKAAQTTGDTAADAMFGAGIKAGKGLVKGLRGQRKGIQREMLQLAKFMERAIKKALGIRSPSKVMEDIGQFTAEGFAMGIRKNNAPSHAMESMLFSTGGGRTASSGGRGGRPIIVYQTITLDGRVVARQIFDPMREEIAHRGGNVQQALGRG